MENNHINVFGLKELSRKIPELLMKDVKDKHDPDKWTWTPFNPEKIKDMKSIVADEKQSVKYTLITNYTPSEKRQKVLLCFWLGNLSYGLIKHMEDNGVKYVYINYLHFIGAGKITILMEDSIQRRVLAIDDLEVDLADISVVVWNPPSFPNGLFDAMQIPPNEIDERRSYFLFRKRWGQLLRDFIHLLGSETVWIPGDPFHGFQDWQNKIGEYHLAGEYGLCIPPTLFTNQAAEALEFSERHNNKLLLREFSTPPYSFPPVPVDIRELDLSNLPISPCCFQAYIEKVHEYRVVVIFDKVLACKIHSQDSELTRNDWRVHDDAKVKWELDTLPKELNEKLIRFRNKLHLTWCSIDMIYSTDGNYYFLEMNRPGAHYWLDSFVGVDITKEIVNSLVEKKLVEKLEYEKV